MMKKAKGTVGALYKTLQTTHKIKKFLKSHPQSPWNDPNIQNFSKDWGLGVLNDLNIKVETLGQPTSQAAIYVGNHLSYIDIIALYSIMHLCFVSKSELSSWPIIGPATRSVGTIMVKRDSTESRHETAQTLVKAVRDEQKSVCIFPEGTTSINGKSWRNGVFRIAQENDLWVQPMGFVYNPIRRAAYIDDDTLIGHMWELIENEATLLKIKFFEAQKITKLDEDMKSIEKEVRDWVDQELRLQGYFESSTGYIE